MLKENDARYSPHYGLTLRVKPGIGELIEELSKKTGLSKTSVIVNAVRLYAKHEGVSEKEQTT